MDIALVSILINGLVFAVTLGLLGWTQVRARGKARTWGTVGLVLMIAAHAMGLGAPLMAPKLGVSAYSIVAALGSLLRLVGLGCLVAGLVANTPVSSVAQRQHAGLQPHPYVAPGAPAAPAAPPPGDDQKRWEQPSQDQPRW